MGGVLAEERPQVPFVVDQHPVGALGSCGAYPSLGIAVRAWGPSSAKISSNALVNLASRSRIDEAEGADPVAEIHEQVAGLLGRSTSRPGGR
jgi:hypothetical protein